VRAYCAMGASFTVRDQDASSVVAKCSGFLFAIAFIVLSNCWLQYRPYITSVITAILSLVAALAMNTIEWSVLASTDVATYTQAMVLIMACFGLLFLHGGYVVWQLVEAPRYAARWDDDSSVCSACCCAAAEGYYVLFVAIAGAVLRFVEPMVRETRGYHRANSTMRYGGGSGSCVYSIVAVIVSAAMFVAALLFQVFATFGRLGGGTVSLAMPAPYLILTPISIAVRSSVRNNQTKVWMNWTNCYPVTVHTFCAAWPLVLNNAGVVDDAQTVLGVLCNLSLAVAVRLATDVVEQPPLRTSTLGLCV
jgi:hypothetical protein